MGKLHRVRQASTGQIECSHIYNFWFYLEGLCTRNIQSLRGFYTINVISSARSARRLPNVGMTLWINARGCPAGSGETRDRVWTIGRSPGRCFDDQAVFLSRCFVQVTGMRIGFGALRD